jgi:ribosomal protein S25/predicted nucleic acid-binding Zn finger protein
MHSVVESDMRFKPKDKTDYRAWLASQEEIWLAEIIAQKSNLEEEIKRIKEELRAINRESHKILEPFYKKRREYFAYLLKHDYDKWFILDPVITLHPDEIFFECFSQDESSYAKLSCSYDVFKDIKEHSYGTTNIDYSQNLYDEFQKIRDYKDTSFKIDPSGFEVATENSDSFREEKIDLPDSWVRGFLQISSAMSLDMVEFTLNPIDIYNILTILKRNRERKSPRSLKFNLEPNNQIKITLEPWNITIKSASIYRGKTKKNIRIWGRRRLFVLERLLPVAKSFRVSLIGSGMPSFWEADLGEMSFTLGLSGWSANDWSSSANFDLIAPKDEVDEITAQKVFDELSKLYFATVDTLAKRLKIKKSLVESALKIYTQEGRVLYDMRNGYYRVRELSNEPLPMEKLRFSNPKEERAVELLRDKAVKIIKKSKVQNSTKVEGSILDRNSQINLYIVIDEDLKLKDAKCSCRYFFQNGLYKGPCEHILALRLKWQRGRRS